MTTQTQSEYFLAHAVDGELTDEQMTTMLSLPVGDTPLESLLGDGGTTAKPASTEQTTTDPDLDDPTPTTATAPATAPSPAPSEPAPATPVLLAKDGVHTIPYSELEAARANEKALQEQLAAAQAALDAIKAPATADPSKTTAAPAPAAGDDIQVDLGDFSEEAVANGIKKAVADGVAARTAALEQQIAELTGKLATVQAQPTSPQPADPVEAHFAAINQAHPDIESIVPSREFAAWRDSKPTLERHGIAAVIEGGSAQEVIEVINAYKVATGKALPTPTPNPSPQQLADNAIARARSATPMSLSEIPGSPAPVDTTQAMTELSAVALMNRMSSMTPDQIMATMDKLV